MKKTKLIMEEFEKIHNEFLKIKKIDNCLGGICEKYWIICNDKKYLFKFPDNNDFSDFGEVFISYLSFLLGFKCVKSRFCDSTLLEDKNQEQYVVDDTLQIVRTGTLIEDFRTKYTKETISLKWMVERFGRRHFSGFTVREVYELCQELANKRNLKLDKNLLTDLKNMALIDYLTLQVDRHSDNIEFLIEEINGIKTLKLAPMFDNGFCLFLFKSYNGIKEINNIYSNNEIVPIKSGNYNTPPMFYIESTEKINNPYLSIVRDLAKELKKNKNLMQIYKNFKELDFEAEINLLKKLYKKPLPKIYIETMVLGTKNRIKILDKELKKLFKNKNDEELVF